MAQHSSDREFVCALQKVHPHPCSTTHVRLAPVFLVHSSVGAHSLLDPRDVGPLCGPRQRDRFHRLTESSPATDCEPSDFIEENTSEVAPTVFQGVSACSASTPNSSEDGASDSCGVRDQRCADFLGMLASPLFSRREEQAQTNQKFITLEEKLLDKAHQTLGIQK